MVFRIPRAARRHIPPGTAIVGVERMSRAFTKFHLDDGRVLHRFRAEEPHADPHDHPWPFETVILEGGYVEEVFHIGPSGAWRSETVHRLPDTRHWIPATHIHRIIALPAGECWTLVRAGPPERSTRFWRFQDGVRSRAWNRRTWQSHS